MALVRTPFSVSPLLCINLQPFSMTFQISREYNISKRVTYLYWFLLVLLLVMASLNLQFISKSLSIFTCTITAIVWTIRTIRAFAFANGSIIRERKTPSKNDKYHTFRLTIYYEVDKPKYEKKNIKNGKNIKNAKFTTKCSYEVPFDKTHNILRCIYISKLSCWKVNGVIS